MKTKKFTGDRIFDFVNVTVILLITIIILVPLLNVLASSFSGSTALAEGGFIFFPKEWSLDNYRAVFKDTSIWKAFFISVAKTVIGVVTHVFFCAMVAFALSKKDLRGRKLYTVMGIITMFFSGGTIPSYLVIRSIGLYDTIWALIIPSIGNVFYIVLMRSYFYSLPAALEEAAVIDGASNMQILLRIFVPLSLPMVATIGFFTFVDRWLDGRAYLSRAIQPKTLARAIRDQTVA